MTGLLTVPEAAAHLRCTDRTVRVMARRGDLRGSRVAGRWLFRVEDVDALVEGHANLVPARRRRRRAS